MHSVPEFEKLFQPLRLGGLELRNRIVMPAMFSSLGDDSAQATPRLAAFLEARAAGGAGLIVVETSCIHRAGRVFAKHLDVSEDKFILGLSLLPAAIQKHGAVAALQISHAGRNANPKLTGTAPLAPSVIATPGLYNAGGGTAPLSLTVAGITEIVAQYAAAADRARRAGFPMVEIYGPPNGLVGQFLSGAANRREDEYGGDVPGRARLLVEVIRAIKQAVGGDFPVSVRLLGMDDPALAGGITLAQAQQTARLAQDAGADLIHLYATSGGYPTPLAEQPIQTPRLLPLAAALKQAVTIPVVAAGAIDPASAEEVLKAGQADLIAMGKALIADPELPLKVARGGIDAVRPCISCLHCLETTAYRASPLECSVNPEAGFETARRIEPAAAPKSVLVAGGGAAGMEAARVAALRGHRVTLYERDAELGGRLLEAVIPPHKENIRSLLRYLKGQLGQLDIKVELGQPLMAAQVSASTPDAVIMATGAVPMIPVQMPGAGGDNVITALACLGGVETEGAVVLVGGGLIGGETALYLAARGKSVTVLAVRDEIGHDIGPALRPTVVARIKAAGIRVETGVEVVEITSTGVRARRAGADEFFPAQTVVLAVGMKSQAELAESLRHRGVRLLLAGDCVSPRRIREAVHEGYLAAAEI